MFEAQTGLFKKEIHLPPGMASFNVGKMASVARHGHHQLPPGGIPFVPS